MMGSLFHETGSPWGIAVLRHETGATRGGAGTTVRKSAPESDICRPTRWRPLAGGWPRDGHSDPRGKAEVVSHM